MNYQDRMIEELEQLEERCTKLEAFLDTDVYDNLPDAEQVLLLAQSLHMASYHLLLSERVDRL